jgi:hypothetical protein
MLEHESQRLQVVLVDAEMRDLQRLARQQHTTVAVRQAIRDARRQEPRIDADRKLEVVRAAARHALPTGGRFVESDDRAARVLSFDTGFDDFPGVRRLPRAPPGAR